MYYIRGRENTKIAVYDLNIGGKQTVVFIHGWPLSAEIFEYQKQFLIEHGFRVVCIDLRGFGESDVTAYGYGYTTFAQDIHAVVRSLQLKSFILAGFSMGGAIALRYMKLFRGESVKKLALLAAAAPRLTRTTNFQYGVLRESIDEWIELAKTDRPKLCEDFSGKLFNLPHSTAVKNWFRAIAVSASGIGTVESACSLRSEDCRDDLLYVNVPTGIFHGKCDVIVPYELAEYQHKMICRSELFSFKDSGHAIFYDELENFNHAFLDFIKS